MKTIKFSKDEDEEEDDEQWRKQICKNTLNLHFI